MTPVVMVPLDPDAKQALPESIALPVPSNCTQCPDVVVPVESWTLRPVPWTDVVEVPKRLKAVVITGEGMVRADGSVVLSEGTPEGLVTRTALFTTGRP